MESKRVSLEKFLKEDRGETLARASRLISELKVKLGDLDPVVDFNLEFGMELLQKGEALLSRVPHVNVLCFVLCIAGVFSETLRHFPGAEAEFSEIKDALYDCQPSQLTRENIVAIAWDISVRSTRNTIKMLKIENKKEFFSYHQLAFFRETAADDGKLGLASARRRIHCNKHLRKVGRTRVVLCKGSDALQPLFSIDANGAVLQRNTQRFDHQNLRTVVKQQFRDAFPIRAMPRREQAEKMIACDVSHLYAMFAHEATLDHVHEPILLGFGRIFPDYVVDVVFPVNTAGNQNHGRIVHCKRRDRALEGFPVHGDDLVDDDVIRIQAPVGVSDNI